MPIFGQGKFLLQRARGGIFFYKNLLSTLN